MPVTRRRRANPPEQPENDNHNHVAEQGEEVAAEPLTTEQAPIVPLDGEQASAAPPRQGVQAPAQSGEALSLPFPPSEALATPAGPVTPPVANGERPPTNERQGPEYLPALPPEGGRRTAREHFRRPTVAAAASVPGPVATFQQPSPPAPSHEITLPLGNLLHLAYNPSYTGAEEARSQLLRRLESESKAGGRARCWNCGSLAVVYDRWETRSKAFGEIGIAYCEICGVWSVM
ncbi:hypothetical protein [Thermogemmatispora onikobensis]|uniref:hypothetical protein n=1 Tax=Thermogemmatispora onikobensis TaxID=732234 RepID=UPI00085363CE|nr:hypothetical protein [Thermogemmatispora onikobensis]